MLVKSVLDEDCGFVSVPVNNPKLRLASRGIIRNGSQIGVLFKENMNEYKLIGGGVDKISAEGYELPEDAFARETLEEAGCHIKNVEFIGTTTEVRSQDNLLQTSFIYVADLKSQLGELNLTEKEIKEGAKFLWLEPNDVLNRMQKSLSNLKAGVNESVYTTTFVVTRDIEILKYYLQKCSNL